MLVSSHHPLVDKLTARRTCLLLQDTSVWLHSECPILNVILALIYSIKKFFAKNQLLAQTPSDLRTLPWLDGKLHVELFALWHLHCRRKAVCFNIYISPVLLIISLTFRSLGSLSNLIALLNQDQFLFSVRGHQAWIYNKYWPIPYF